MRNEDEREQALQQAARLKGLALVRTGDAFALAIYTAATLDEIADFLATDLPPDTPHRVGEERRLADLWAMLRTERAIIAELEEEKRKAGARVPDTTEAALAEIRRKIAEIQDAKRADATGVGAPRAQRR